MQLVKPSIKHLDVTTDPLKAIELAGRTCYKSEGSITEDSAETFVKKLLKREHHAMLEHSNFILSVDSEVYDEILKVEDRQYIRMSCDSHGNGCLISGNLRAFMDFLKQPYGLRVGIQRAIARELNKTPLHLMFRPMLDDHLNDPTCWDDALVQILENVDALTISEKLKHQVASYRIVCNRGFTHEQVRHRPFSYAQESTRYCNYKGGVSFIIPPTMSRAPGDYTIKEHPELGEIIESSEDAWMYAMQRAETYYKGMLADGWKPQQARGVLPIDLKTEIVVTGNLQQWKTFFGLRCTPARAPQEDLVNGIWYHATAPHPQMQEVANMILADIKTRVPVIFDDFGAKKPHVACNICQKLGNGCNGRELNESCDDFKVID